MSHEPTKNEIWAVIELSPDASVVTKLTAANTLRDRRIRNEALEEAARAYETGADWDVFKDAANAILALKEPKP